MILARGICKSFLLHLQGGIRLDVLRDAEIAAQAGECVAISGPSGAGKSTLLRALYGNYLVDSGEILIRHRGQMTDIVTARVETLLDIRRETVGYVSQFLRAVPRVSALEIVAAAAIERGVAPEEARRAGAKMLGRLGIAPRLQALPPSTFSGGEQQRVNIARAFVCPWPAVLLDEPTASLDAANRDIVVELMRVAKAGGAAMIGIFHDLAVREAIADKVVTLQPVREVA